MKPVYISATDIDFSKYILQAVYALKANEDFLAADNHTKKVAIYYLADAFAKTNTVLRGWTIVYDHFQYLEKILTVEHTKPTNDPDVLWTYFPATREVF